MNPLPYSQAILYGGVIYISGQVPVDPETLELVSGGVEAHTRRVLENIKAILEDAGSSMENVLKVTVYLQDVAHFDAMNRVYEAYFPQDPPAWTTVGAQIRGGRLVEMDAIAALPHEA